MIFIWLFFVFVVGSISFLLLKSVFWGMSVHNNIDEMFSFKNELTDILLTLLIFSFVLWALLAEHAPDKQFFVPFVAAGVLFGCGCALLLILGKLAMSLMKFARSKIFKSWCFDQLYQT